MYIFEMYMYMCKTLSTCITPFVIFHSFMNLPELESMHLEWFFEMNDSNPPDNPLFVKSELEEIVGNCKNKFQVTISENDKLIKISRISREM